MTPANTIALHNKHIIKCLVYISTEWCFEYGSFTFNTDTIYTLFGFINEGVLFFVFFLLLFSFGYYNLQRKKITAIRLYQKTEKNNVLEASGLVLETQDLANQETWIQ